jgi:hypothetical protein
VRVKKIDTKRVRVKKIDTKRVRERKRERGGRDRARGER